MFEHTSDSRMQLCGIGDLMHPGACMVCGSGNREQGYVNLGVYYEYEGNMYLCFTCLTEAAEVIGMLTSDEALILRNEAGQVFRENTKLKEELNRANERLVAIDSVLSGLAVAGAFSTDSPAVAVEGEGQISDGGNDVSTGTNAGEPESAKPVTSDKPAGVSRVKRSNSSSATNTIEL